MVGGGEGGPRKLVDTSRSSSGSSVADQGPPRAIAKNWEDVKNKYTSHFMDQNISRQNLAINLSFGFFRLNQS